MTQSNVPKKSPLESSIQYLDSFLSTDNTTYTRDSMFKMIAKLYNYNAILPVSERKKYDTSGVPKFPKLGRRLLEGMQNIPINSDLVSITKQFLLGSPDSEIDETTSVIDKMKLIALYDDHEYIKKVFRTDMKLFKSFATDMESYMSYLSLNEPMLAPKVYQYAIETHDINLLKYLYTHFPQIPIGDVYDIVVMIGSEFDSNKYIPMIQLFYEMIDNVKIQITSQLEHNHIVFDKMLNSERMQALIVILFEKIKNIMQEYPFPFNNFFVRVHILTLPVSYDLYEIFNDARRNVQIVTNFYQSITIPFSEVYGIEPRNIIASLNDLEKEVKIDKAKNMLSTLSERHMIKLLDDKIKEFQTSKSEENKYKKDLNVIACKLMMAKTQIHWMFKKLKEIADTNNDKNNN